MIRSLENPVWEALGSRQKHFNTGTNSVKYFPADVSPFIGLERWDDTDIHILPEQMPPERSFSVMIAKQINLPPTLKIILSLPLYQMYCPKFREVDMELAGIRKLHRADVPLMLDLTGRTKPGPFFERTIELGDYYGLFQDDRLVSMAGERLKLPGYTEVSAICTDPEYAGKGYASLLTSVVCRHIIDQNNTPFLHVRADNTRAIEVYRKLGFEIRADVFFAIFRKA